MTYQPSQIADYLHRHEHATPDAAHRAGQAIATAWNDREFGRAATLGPLTRCATASPGMPPAAEVLGRLVRRFGTHVYDLPTPNHPNPPQTGERWVSSAPILTCHSCHRAFPSDRTPLGEAGYCLLCRPALTVPCDRCGARCPGAHDGLRQCATCRAVPLGIQQYQDKQTTTTRAPRGTRQVRRVLVTGSRTWTDHTLIRTALTPVWRPGVVLISGACPRGADLLCEQCWTRWGGPVERHPADWHRHGNTAGMVRNQHMVNLGADLCLAFIRNHSPGATHCAATAEAAGIPTRIYHQTRRAAA